MGPLAHGVDTGPVSGSQQSWRLSLTVRRRGFCVGRRVAIHSVSFASLCTGVLWAEPGGQIARPLILSMKSRPQQDTNRRRLTKLKTAFHFTENLHSLYVMAYKQYMMKKNVLSLMKSYLNLYVAKSSNSQLCVIHNVLLQYMNTAG